MKKLLVNYLIFILKQFISNAIKVNPYDQPAVELIKKRLKNFSLIAEQNL